MTEIAVKMMKNIFIFTFLLVSVLVCSCSRVNNSSHVGDRKLSDVDFKIDSITVSADTTSLRGNFVMLDSIIMFVDQLYCKIYSYDISNGNLKATYSGYGKGANEMVGILYGMPVNPNDTAMWIFDSSYGVYEFLPSKGTTKYKGMVDFGWRKPSKNDYTAVSNYTPMEMSDFNMKLTRINDSTLLIPVSLINRNFSKLSLSRYEHGKILGKLNTNTMKIEKLWGSFPDFYKDNPMPLVEFFDYAVDQNDSKIYVNHAPDSLIYCYDMNGDLINTLGYSPDGINRNYKTGFDAMTFETYKDDLAEVGVNTGLYYDKESQLLFRTSIKNMSSGESVMQVYQNNNLIIEKTMPTYFKLLGRHKNRYYGVRFIPLNTKDKSQFVIYSFTLPLKNSIDRK